MRQGFKAHLFKPGDDGRPHALHVEQGAAFFEGKWHGLSMQETGQPGERARQTSGVLQTAVARGLAARAATPTPTSAADTTLSASVKAEP